LELLLLGIVSKLFDIYLREGFNFPGVYSPLALLKVVRKANHHRNIILYFEQKILNFIDNKINLIYAAIVAVIPPTMKNSMPASNQGFYSNIYSIE